MHTHIFTDRFHGLDGFNLVQFSDPTQKEDEELAGPDPLVDAEHAAVAMVRIVKKYPGESAWANYSIDLTFPI